MNSHNEIDEWNNPLRDIATQYWQNGLSNNHGGCYEVTLTREELITVVGYMMLGMHKVKEINKKEGN